MNRLVAIKTIRAGVFATEAEVQRFHIEAEAFARLDHPGIVPIHEVGKIEDCYYFSMKLIPGGSLANHLHALRADPRAAVQIVIGVAHAIQHAHQRGILHRDLKPANILLDENHRPQVTDFGLAKRFGEDSSLTESGAILGTPSYMAPEKAAGRKGLITTLTDVYGVGAVLYALLTGHAPFVAETVLETIEQVRQRPPVPPSRFNPLIGRDLETVCLKCLEKEPRRRYASAEALADDLQHLLDAEPIAARRVSARERAWMWCRRNPVVASLLAALVVFALGITGLWRRSQGLVLQLEYDATSTAIDQALALCDQGKVGSGMLKLARVLETAPANAADLRRATRANLVVWSRYSTRLVNLLPNDKEVYFVAFSPDGRTALTLSPDSSAQLWDAMTGERRGEVLRHRQAVTLAAFSPDGRVVLTGSLDHTAQLWEVATGRPLGSPLRHGGPVRSVAFSPDGRTVLTGSNDGNAQVWEVASQRPLGEPLHLNCPVQKVVFRPDGKVAFCAARDGFVRLWDLKTSKIIGDLFPYQPGNYDIFPLQLVVCAPDGRSILTNGAGRPGQPRGAQLWDATNGQEIARLPHDGNVRAVAFSRNGMVAITGSEDHTALQPKYAWLSVAWSPDGTMLLTGGADGGDGIAQAFSARTQLPIGQHMIQSGPVLSVAFSPDSRTVATASVDHSAQLWDSATGKPIGPRFKHDAPVTAVGFSSDGNDVLTRTQNGVVRRWERTPDVPGPDERFILWTQVATGAELDANVIVHGLHPSVWKQRSDRLQAQGGPPAP